VKAKVFRGGVWLGAGSSIEQLVRFGRNMILARILAPEAFGTMAIVLSATTLINTLTDIGVREAIIQNPRGEEREYISVAYWLSLGRAAALTAMVFAMAPWVARFFSNSDLTALLRVTSLGIVIGGATSPALFVDMKRLKFKYWAILNHGGAICGVLATIGLSLVIRNVWALVLGAVAENAARTILSYVFYPYLPSFTWSRGASRELVGFSKGLIGLSFLNLVFARADIVVLGKLYSPADLGLYTMAVYLVQTPVSFLMNLFGQTLMPTFAHVRSDTVRENRILVQITSLIVVLGIPVIAFLYFCGHSVLGVVYGHRYTAASGALVVAACVALFNLANGQITTIFYARGVPHLHRRAVALMAAIMIALIYPAAKRYGLLGGQVACLVAVFVGFLFQLARIRALTGLELGRYLKIFFVSAAMSLTVPAVYLSSRLWMPLANPAFTIALGVAGCLLAYVLTTAVLLRGKSFS